MVVLNVVLFDLTMPWAPASNEQAVLQQIVLSNVVVMKVAKEVMKMVVVVKVAKLCHTSSGP